ncbi:MAG: chitobiase/beta-hexosaminidase C-terminal domain-containing protein [Patescibacteria group bacterium]|jgi:hypothetical protein
MRKILWLFLILISVIFVGQNVKAADWSASTITILANITDTELKVDTNDKIHICYYAIGDEDLVYVNNLTGSWTSEIVDGFGGPDVGRYSSLALDSNNKAHISYYDTDNTSLKYATNVSGSWQTEQVDATGVVGRYTSIAVGSDSEAHISYYYSTGQDLKYAKGHYGSWSTEVVDDTSTDMGKYTAIELDSNNYPQISYYDDTNNHLRFVTNSSGSWVRETLDDVDMGDYTSTHMDLGVDSGDNVHICYFDNVSYDLKYITGRPSFWGTVQILDSSGTVGSNNSLAIDSNDKVRITYSGNGLKYATNVSGSWATYTIGASSSGYYTSIDVDSNNRSQVCNYDIATGLVYTYTPGPSLAALIINSGATYTNSSSLTLGLSSSSDTLEMATTENSSSFGSAWTTYGTSQSFTLSASEGTKTVYAKFRDTWYAETAAVSASIVYDATAPEVLASVKKGTYKNIKKVALSATDALSGVDKIYYTTNGKKPKTTSDVYSKKIVVSKDMTLKFMAIDNAGNQSSVVSKKYVIKKAKFVTKKANDKTVKIKGKNHNYFANDFDFVFKKYSKSLKKYNYYWQVQRFKKYPITYVNAENMLLKKNWLITTDLNQLSDSFKIKVIFYYTKKEFKVLKKKMTGLKESDLHLKLYDVELREWSDLDARQNNKENTFTIYLNSPFDFSERYYAIGR